eukprot:scaffold184_cov179-Amphora_coffeaeformis.AAC.2
MNLQDSQSDQEELSHHKVRIVGRRAHLGLKVGLPSAFHCIVAVHDNEFFASMHLNRLLEH